VPDKKTIPNMKKVFENRSLRVYSNGSDDSIVIIIKHGRRAIRIHKAGPSMVIENAYNKPGYWNKSSFAINGFNMSFVV